MVSAMVHNTAQGVKRSKKLTDFRPKYKAKAKQSGAEIERAFMALGEKLKQNGNSGKAGSSTVGKR